MAQYVYQAKGSGGRLIKGEIDASSDVEARVKLRAQSLIPVKVVQKGENAAKGAVIKSSGKVKPKDLQVFTRQFATLINSGVAAVQALQILANNSRSPVLKAATTKIRIDVESGKPLADAMMSFPNIFDDLYINLVRAGQEAGLLDTILNRLAAYIEKSVKLVGKIKGAMVYPVAIIGVAVLVVTGIMTFVIPKFEEMFKGTGRDLPLLTQYVIQFSHLLRDYWYAIFGGLFAVIVGVGQYRKTKEGKIFFDQYMLKVPLIGDIIFKGGIARFSRTLSTLISSGVTLLDALDISSRVVGNFILEQSVLKAKAMVQEGKTLQFAFTKIGIFPDMVINMMAVGEQTGDLPGMLGKVADFYEEEVETAVGTLTSMMEPILMVVLGGIIAFIVIAMYLPIFDLAGGV
ncbi:MAG: type II secretion system F family protein [Bdellovibrionales bacterium CG10_big_fil_rev_8_21_14_0_10_45_34]|nr:MAG: type II secretion system F family protein [Bdellovibrionales bacterium CG10_big_fil_rev_8_21_14_0_10_45_34]